MKKLKFKYIEHAGRAVLIDGSFLNLEESGDIVVVIDGFLQKNANLIVKTSQQLFLGTFSINDGSAIIERNRLKKGIICLEIQTENGRKIICTPIEIRSVNDSVPAFIAYPSVDGILNDLASLTATVAELKQWKEAVAPLIHEHKITL